MNVKQEFLKLAGLTESASIVEAEDKAAVEFAKNSPEVATVKLAVRKAVRQCEKEASEVRSPNLRKTYERDAESYDYILGLVTTGKQSAAAKAWAYMDTAARDVVFEVTTDKESRKIVAAYFGTTLLREGVDKVQYVVLPASKNSTLADIITKVSTAQELKNLIKGAQDEVTGYELFDEDKKEEAYTEARKRLASATGVKESADENDDAVDADIAQLKKDVAQLKKDQAKDVDDEGAEDDADTKVTATIKKVEAAVDELDKAQKADDEEGVKESLDRNEQQAAANKLRKLYDKRAVLKNAMKEAMGTRSEEAVDDLDEELQDLEKEISALENSLDEGKNHMGDREYQSYGSWKAACKKAHPGCSFRGDKDIGAAVVDNKDVGEWDGAVGSVYAAQTVKESDEVKVVDFADAVKDEKEEKEEKAKIPAEVTKALKDKIKELEDAIKYTSHLPSQEQEIINLNGAVRVMADILDLMDKGCDYSMKKISILLTSLEGPQKVMVPKEVWKFMAFDFANPVSKSNLMDKFREVKAHATKVKD